ncbi:hypothetical protein [Alkalihalobacillus sp. BA299]|uniref:hypothetical protein n=1 Tax=Alkalihalobacillus sp. BA299 TaxID=2815938 RepID=UPI001ADC80E6|nr:hypothetical protein [Alkalihalobacillus sp. BA299]
MFLNYETATKKDWLRVLSWEAHLVMVAEMYKEIGNEKARRDVLQIKKSVSIQRKIVQAVLKANKNAVCTPIQTA